MRLSPEQSGSGSAVAAVARRSPVVAAVLAPVTAVIAAVFAAVMAPHGAK